MEMQWMLSSARCAAYNDPWACLSLAGVRSIRIRWMLFDGYDGMSFTPPLGKANKARTKKGWGVFISGYRPGTCLTDWTGVIEQRRFGLQIGISCLTFCVKTGFVGDELRAVSSMRLLVLIPRNFRIVFGASR